MANPSGLKTIMREEFDKNQIVVREDFDKDVDDFFSKLSKANCVNLPPRGEGRHREMIYPQFECEIKYKEMYQAGYKIIQSLGELDQ